MKNEKLKTWELILTIIPFLIMSTFAFVITLFFDFTIRTTIILYIFGGLNQVLMLLIGIYNKLNDILIEIGNKNEK